MRFTSFLTCTVASLAVSACGVALDFNPPDPQNDAAVGGDGGGTDAGTPDAGRCRTDAQCDDGLFCNGIETCSGGACLPGVAVTCPAGVIRCVTSACDESMGHCASHADDTRCAASEYCDPTTGCTTRPTCTGDGDCIITSDLCTRGTCAMGVCHFAPVVCTDSDTSDCLVPACDPSSGGCAPHPIDALCEDGLLCTSSTCQGDGSCTPQRGDDTLCDVDGAACTTDTCAPSNACADPASGCVHAVDGTYCVTFGTGVTLPGIPPGCAIGVCSPATALDPASGCAATPLCTAPGTLCAADAGIAICTDILPRTCSTSDTVCNDANPCNGVETCDRAAHHCVAGAPPCGPAGSAGGTTCTVDLTTGGALCSTPIAACGTLPSGADCPGPDGETCAAGLSCCYPCGVAGCTNQCMPTCTGPGCLGECPLFP